MATWKKVHVEDANTTHGTITATLGAGTDITSGDPTANLVVSATDGTSEGALTVAEVTFGAAAFLSASGVITGGGGLTSANFVNDLVTGAGLTGGADNVLFGSEGDTTISLAAIDDLKVLGNTSGSSAAPTAVTILDSDTFTGASATTLATSESIKAYVDASVADAGGGDITGVGAGTGLNGGGDTGSVTLNVDAAQTGITSILNTSLSVGRDTDNTVGFGTDNTITFKANGANQVTITDGLLAPSVTEEVALGSASLKFTSLSLSGTANADSAIIGGNVIASSGNTTINGILNVPSNAATFGDNVTIAGNLTVSGTTTTVNTTELIVEDKVITLASNATPTPDTGSVAGIEIDTATNGAHSPRIVWTKDLGASNDGTYDGTGAVAGLTGWSCRNHQETNQAVFPIAVMEFEGASATAPTGNSAGVGSFFFASSNIGTADGDLYLRVS